MNYGYLQAGVQFGNVTVYILQFQYLVKICSTVSDAVTIIVVSSG